MRKLIFILLLSPGLIYCQQLFIGGDARFHIQSNASLQIGGDLENNGVIENFGSISLYGNWSINNIYNDVGGELVLLGSSDQVIELSELTISELTINQGGIANFPGDEYIITDKIDFQFGNIEVGPDTRFILGENAQVIGGSNDSYFEGTLISRGSGIKIFPIGSNGIHAPITLLNVFGVDSEISASYSYPNPVNPMPADTILGISNRGLWELELVGGGTDPTLVEIEFNQEDLTDLPVRNNIRHRVNSPVIAYSTDLAGTWGSLGIEELLDSDSLTYGRITGEIPIRPMLNQKVYLAIGLAPQVPNEGLYFIPEAFSPNATDPANQAFRVFGENISNEDFFLTIFNRLGVEVYSTTSFVEANRNGWNGNNQVTGAEEPTGIYYYQTRFKFVTGQIIEKSGAFYLVK